MIDMAQKSSKSTQSKQYIAYKKIANKKALDDLDILSPKDYAKKYFAFLKKRSSAEGKVRRLKSGRDLVEKTKITKQPKIKAQKPFVFKKTYKSYNSPKSPEFQFIETNCDLLGIKQVILNAQTIIEKTFDRISKKAKNYKWTKLHFSVDYIISFLDKSSGMWFKSYGTFQESYAIILKTQIKTALDDICGTPTVLGALDTFFKCSDSIEFIIKSPGRFYLKAIKK